MLFCLKGCLDLSVSLFLICLFVFQTFYKTNNKPYQKMYLIVTLYFMLCFPLTYMEYDSIRLFPHQF